MNLYQLREHVQESSEQKTITPCRDPWQDEQFLVQAEMKICEDQSRYEELSLRLTKIITGQKCLN